MTETTVKPRLSVAGAVGALIVALLVAASCLCATSAHADDGATVSTSIQPTFGAGELEGCQVVFNVLHRNPEYFGNDLALVSGGVLISANKGKVPTVMIKLGVAKTSGASSGQFEAPTNVYLVDGLKTNIKDKVATGRAETTGHALFIYRLDVATLAVLETAMASGKFKIAYSLHNGGLGSQFVADINITNSKDGHAIPDNTALDRFQQCFLALPLIPK
jgi:hypothetical protein